MKVNILIISVWALTMLVGCRKEDDLAPSKNGMDYFEIQDKPGRFNQLAYQIYSETKMPIFVNDTLGAEYRGEDAYGQPIIHYERFVLGYTITAQWARTDMALSADTNAMVKAAEVIRDLVLPRLPKDKAYRPYSLLLADTLYNNYYGWNASVGLYPYGKTDYAVDEMMGIVVGKLSDILEMSEDELAFWAGRILAVNISSDIQSVYEEELEDFYMVSKKNATATYHDGTFYGFSNGTAITPEYGIDYRENGFTEWIWDGPHPTIAGRNVRKYPSKAMDVTNYIAMVYAYDEEKFEQMNAGFPKCIEKYKLMKELVEKFEERISQ